MHSFFIFGAVLHSTALAMLSFFVFFTASKTEGRLAFFGNLLGIWLFILALIALVFVAIMLASGGQMPDGYGYGYGHRMMGGSGWGWMHGTSQPPATTP
ncbi:MAG: hypothetical protein WA138_13770 [Parvibaculum sp.]